MIHAHQGEHGCMHVMNVIHTVIQKECVVFFVVCTNRARHSHSTSHVVHVNVTPMSIHIVDGGNGMFDSKARPKNLDRITVTFNPSLNQPPSFVCISESWQAIEG